MAGGGRNGGPMPTPKFVDFRRIDQSDGVPEEKMATGAELV